ncbi:hypothetical protein [Pedobacter metabolipauper]|uniref:Uncharacterized protein n=1 Tax=Pedobacter metabolipauper TaxID=425513 RepID=A0A4R6T0R9_9SPHI|nr:hypothetical protein [Pedobacter metabolipauper]TDQ11975.1 hypothetical protein ATK78_1105 [Pedobacter metabolipauper]
MDIKLPWLEDVRNSLSILFKVTLSLSADGVFQLIHFGPKNFSIHLVSADLDNPAELIALQERYQQNGIYLVHLWQDIWHTRKEQVLGRITSILGFNQRIHGRKTQVISVDQQTADDFFNHNHLQASAKCRYKFALKYNDQIVAVAGFSNLRRMKNTDPGYRSAELIRFASLTGYTVTGGFTKLLKHFIGLYQPNDIMSYADRDWSLGQAYKESGFECSEITQPSVIYLDKKELIRYFPHRLPDDRSEPDFIKIFNTGNLKYILYL